MGFFSHVDFLIVMVIILLTLVWLIGQLNG